MALTPAQVVEALRRANDTQVFPTLCRIQRMDGTLGPIVPTTTQIILFDFFRKYRWTYTDKYRQAMSSVAHIANILRRIAYNPGSMGLVVGDKEDTYKELLRRAVIMYNGLPEPVKPPLSRPASSEALAFAHDGVLQGLTGGGENPAIGFSPDDSVVTEYGLFDNYDGFNGSFFPAVSRRPNAECRIETTPGPYGSPAQAMFFNALEGKGRFQAIFLSWWHDDTCFLTPPSDFQRTSEETAYAAKLLEFERANIGKSWYAYAAPRPITDGHLYFRRIALETEFHGDPRLFDAKFPPSPWEGWLISASPTIPAEPVERMLRTAVDMQDGEEVFFEQREPGCPYLITVDGKGYGKAGDPAAITLWNMWDWKEAGSWSGDEDPGVITPRILRWQRAYDADVIVETNKDGVAAALQASSCPKLHWSNSQPGWYSTEVSKRAALIDLVNMLRAGEVQILSRPTLVQLATWDGKTRAQETGRRKHHWDRAITVLLFAYGARVLGHQRRPRRVAPKPPGPMTAEEFLGLFAKPDRGRVLGTG